MDKNKLELLSAENSVLLLVDYQPAMFRGVGSGNRTTIRAAAVGAVKAAKILDVPVVLSVINPKMNGNVIKEISEIFPDKIPFDRKIPSFDALEDEAVLAELKKIGKKKIIISGLWTSMCFCYTALHAIKEGYEVYGLMDAAGDASKCAHKNGIKRMTQVGVVPITLLSLVSEWMHDWANPKSGELMKEVYSKFEAMLGM
jgi:nicotinamidase-related amidase